MNTLKECLDMLNPINWIRFFILIVAFGKAIGEVFGGNPYFSLWRN